jgi:hypothetical protein
MGEYDITQYGIGQLRKHRDLNGCNDFSRLHPESGEAKNAIAFRIDKGFEKASCLRERTGCAKPPPSAT